MHIDSSGGLFLSAFFAKRIHRYHMTIEVDPRKALRAARRALSPVQRIRGAQDLAPRLLELPFAPVSGYVAGYWAMDGEIALHAWQLNLPGSVVFCLPVLHDDGVLKFAPWRVGDPLTHNRFNIPEPVFDKSSLLSGADMALVVMPLVGFTDQGHRVGMRGGWYDRTFAFRSEPNGLPPYLVGVGFDEQELTTPVVRNAWDVRPDAICTPTRTLIFGE